MIPTLVLHCCQYVLEGPVSDRENNPLYLVSVPDYLVNNLNYACNKLLSKKLDPAKEQKVPNANVTSCCFDYFSNLYAPTAKSLSTHDSFGRRLLSIEFNKN